MVKKSRFKQRVRARMESDGVNYTEARRRVIADDERRSASKPEQEG